MAAPVAEITSDSPLISTNDGSTIPLATILSTPIAMSEGAVLPAAPIFFDMQTPGSLFSKSAYMLEKVRGYIGIRPTVVVRLVVNADKYTQGRLILAFKPQATPQAVWRDDHRHMTQLHHVTLDLNTETEVSLRIPYRGPFTHYDIMQGRYNTGIVQLREILKHRGNAYSYTLYMHFEDIDLLGPTTSNTIAYQGNIEKESENMLLSKKVKILSSAMMNFSNIPYLSSFVTPLAWASGVASKVISAFGFSKPVTTLSPSIQFFRNRPLYNTSDGVDTADVLALTMSNAIKVDPGAGLTGLDEMSMAYLLGINSVVYRSLWDIAAEGGELLSAFPLYPLGLKSNVSANTNVLNAAMIPHPIAFLADLFDKYRGSLTLTVDLAKTIFHSGRLLITFVPSTGNLRLYNAVPTIGASSGTFAQFRETTRNCHKDIIDIRKGNKFVINFPYMALTPYTNVEHSYGTVYMHILNPLVAADAAVAPSIDFSFSFKAGEDFEFAVPSIPRYFPLEQVLEGEGGTINSNAQGTLQSATYQSGLEVSNTLILDKCSGSSTKGPVSTVFAEHCIGEKILSVKQIAMRSKPFFTTTMVSATFPLNPFYIDVFKDESMRDLQIWNNASPPVRYAGILRDSQKMFDYYSYIGSMYGLVRGGVVFTLESISTNANFFAVTHNHVRPSFKNYGEWALSARVSNFQTERVYVPPYNNGVCRYTFSTPLTPVPVNNSKGDYTNTYGYCNQSMSLLDVNGSDATTFVSRCAADDTQFLAFRGCPYIILRKPYADISPGTTIGIIERKIGNGNLYFPTS